MFLILGVKNLSELSTIGCKFLASIGNVLIIGVKNLSEFSTIGCKFMASIGNVSDNRSEKSK